jgi:hypothetical protein
MIRLQASRPVGGLSMTPEKNLAVISAQTVPRR